MVISLRRCSSTTSALSGSALWQRLRSAAALFDDVCAQRQRSLTTSALSGSALWRRLSSAAALFDDVCAQRQRSSTTSALSGSARWRLLRTTMFYCTFSSSPVDARRRTLSSTTSTNILRRKHFWKYQQLLGSTLLTIFVVSHSKLHRGVRETQDTRRYLGLHIVFEDHFNGIMKSCDYHIWALAITIYNLKRKQIVQLHTCCEVIHQLQN